MSLSEEELKDILENGRDFMRVPVSDMPGIFITRHPAMFHNPAYLIVELNPVREDGTLEKEVGTPLMTRKNLEDSRRYYNERLEEAKAYIKLLPDARLDKLLEAVEEVNEGRPPKVQEDISVEELGMILRLGREWERIPVENMPGVFIVKTPSKPDYPAHLVVEVNPVRDDGTLMKDIGVLLRTREELQRARKSYHQTLLEAERYLKLLSYPGLDKLVENVEGVNPK